MGSKVNKFTPTMTAVKINNSGLEHDGQAGYVVEPPEDDEDTVGVKMDVDAQVYQFAQGDVETLV